MLKNSEGFLMNILAETERRVTPTTLLCTTLFENPFLSEIKAVVVLRVYVSYRLTYLALLGGSNCMTQSTSGMSTPRAMTSVQIRTPLETKGTKMCNHGL